MTTALLVGDAAVPLPPPVFGAKAELAPTPLIESADDDDAFADDVGGGDEVGGDDAAPCEWAWARGLEAVSSLLGSNTSIGMSSDNKTEFDRRLDDDGAVSDPGAPEPDAALRPLSAERIGERAGRLDKTGAETGISGRLPVMSAADGDTSRNSWYARMRSCTDSVWRSSGIAVVMTSIALPCCGNMSVRMM
jgi:hypothetical protein